jgi:hypothetical protein
MNSWPTFLNNSKKVIHKWKHYFPIYDKHFSRYINRPCIFIEIGCGEGGSLQMWKSLLGPHAQIIGIDIRPECKNFEEDQIAIRIGDQSDTKFLQSILDEFGVPDIVLDDGSHVMTHIQSSFNYLYTKISPSGIYLVEDLHAAYWDEYGGGLNREGSFIETIKSLIDELNADHSRGALKPTEFTKSTHSMHLYDSVCVFEKGRTLNKSAPQIGKQ